MFMTMLVLNNPDRRDEILDAWENAGVSGVTILPSTGLGRIRRRLGLEEGIPLMPSLEDFLAQDQNTHLTLMAVIREREIVDRVIAVTQSILGDLDQPNTGILLVLPVLEAYGVDRYKE